MSPFAIDPASLPEMPAPFWFVELFKGIGFGLHLIPMGLWFTGLPIVLLSLVFGKCGHSKIYAKRMLSQLPVMMALGINFGIVPLLFLQTAYYKPFYTGTILTAWHWLFVIPLLLVGYYAVYAASFAIKPLETPPQCDPEKPRLGKAGHKAVFFGAVASISLAAIGLLIVNGITLMENPGAWQALWERTNVGGATTGLGNNMRDPNVWMHFVTMFAIGMITTAVYAVFDSHVLCARKKDEQADAYRKWTLNFAAMLGLCGVILFMVVFAKYLQIGPFVQLNDMGKINPGPWSDVTIVGLFAVFLAPAAAIGLIFVVKSTANSIRLKLALLFGSYVGFLAAFVVVRQQIQNAKIGIDFSQVPMAVQWSPLIAFLISFIFGAAVIGWIILQLMKAPER